MRLGSLAEYSVLRTSYAVGIYSVCGPEMLSAGLPTMWSNSQPAPFAFSLSYFREWTKRLVR